MQQSETEKHTNDEDNTNIESVKRVRLSEEHNIHVNTNMTRKPSTFTPNLITAEQRYQSQIKRLQIENEKLKNQLVQMTERNENIYSKNRFEEFNQMEEEPEAQSDRLEEPHTQINFETMKKRIKGKNTLPIPNKPRQVIVENLQSSNNTINKENRSVKPPPIHIHTQSIQNTLSLIKGININDFEIKRVNNEKHSVITRNVDEFEKVKNVFDEVNTKYFSYTPKSEKPKTLILKGLNEDENLNEIKLEIEQIGKLTILNLSQLKTKRSIEQNKKLPLYIVQFVQNTDMSKVYNIKTINYQRVNWENLKKSSEIMQCKNCQRLGHAATNCKLDYRCVKCQTQHKPGECSIKNKIEDTNIFCVNCNDKGHPASYKGCPVYQQAIEKLRKKIQEKREKSFPTTKNQNLNINNPPSNVRSNITYADTVKNRTDETLTIQQLSIKVDKMTTIIEQQSQQIANLLNIIQGLLNP